MKPLNFHDYRSEAKRHLPKSLFEYIDRGTEDEVGIGRHRAGLDAITLTPTMLTGHAKRDLSTEIFGRRMALPLAVAPTALAGLVVYEGEVALARAAQDCDVPYCVSTQSVTTIEDIRAGAPSANLWFQLYVWRDRKLTEALLKRVADCGISTLVVTSDTPVLPNREYNERNGFTIPFKPTARVMADMAMHPRWLWSVMVAYLRTTGTPVFAHYPAEFRSGITRPSVAESVRIEFALNWDDIAALRRVWKGELVVKGILDARDAVRAAELGVDGVVVSTHGARNLDMAPTTAQALPRIADAVGDRMTILADSGVQRGSDVIKYLALGAKGVLLGRMPLWGLAAGGRQGVVDMFAMMANEIDIGLALLGQENLAGIADCPIHGH